MVSLKLPKESVWELWPVSGKEEISVRECYETALNHCHTAWNADFQIVFLKGTPGVGKSVFLDYALSSLITDGKKVLLILVAMMLLVLHGRCMMNECVFRLSSHGSSGKIVIAKSSPALKVRAGSPCTFVSVSLLVRRLSMILQYLSLIKCVSEYVYEFAVSS